MSGDPERRRRRHQRRLRLMSLWPRPRARARVFVLSNGRDGSNLCTDYLASVSGVHMGGEVLNPDVYEGIPNPTPANEVRRHLARSFHALGGAVRGVKLHFWALATRDLSPDDVNDWFPDARWIVIYRESLAEQYVSRQRAFASGQWLLRDPDKRRSVTVPVDAADFHEFAREIRGYYEQLLTRPWLAQRGVLFSYEQLAQDPQAVFDERVFPLLGLPSSPIRTSLHKQNTRHLADVVENYDEVASTLEGDEARQTYTL